MHMDMPRHTRACSLANIHPQINAIGRVELPQNMLHSLRKLNHFVGRLRWQLLQLVQVGERNDHYVSSRIWVGVENDVTVLASVHDTGFCVVPELWQVTKDASRSLVDAGNVGVAPGCPKIVHRRGE